MKNFKINKTKVMISLFAFIMVLAVLSACGSGVEESEPGETPTPTEQNTEEPTDGDAEEKRPEEIYRFESSALHEPGAVTINPGGSPLNIGCEDCQDIYYASRSFTVEEAATVVKEKFGVEEMIQDENFIRFDLHLDEIRRLELELDLIAAKKLESSEEIIDIRITSIKPDEH